MGRLMARLREEQIVCRIYALKVIMVSAHLPSDKGPISFLCHGCKVALCVGRNGWKAKSFSGWMFSSAQPEVGPIN